MAGIGDNVLFYKDADAVSNDEPAVATILYDEGGGLFTIQTVENNLLVTYGPTELSPYIQRNATGVGMSVAPAAYTFIQAESTGQALVRAAQRCLVWQPGGTSAGSVYATLGELETALAAISGEKVVVIDNSVTATPTINQTIDWSGAVLSGDFVALPGAVAVPVTVADGIELQNVRGLSSGLALTYAAVAAGSAAPIRDLQDGQVFTIDGGVTVATTNGASFIDLSSISDGQIAIICIEGASQLGSFGPGNPAIKVPANKFCIIPLDRADILEDALDVAVGGFVQVQFRSSTASVDPSQALFLGTYFPQFLENPRTPTTTITASGADAGGTVSFGEFATLSANHTGATQWTASALLPPSSTFATNATIRVALTASSTGLGSVVPSGVDTIDGVAGAQTLDAGESVELMSQVGGWLIVAGGFGTSIFGRDFDTLSVPAEQSTTIEDPNYAIATTYVTDSLLWGMYEIKLTCAHGLDATNRESRLQLYNLTDAVLVNGTRVLEPKDTDNRYSQVLTGTVSMTGSAKTFQVRWNTNDSDDEAYISDIFITFKRVS